MVLSVRAESASDGNRKLTWPLFKPANKDPVLGKYLLKYLYNNLHLSVEKQCIHDIG